MWRIVFLCVLWLAAAAFADTAVASARSAAAEVILRPAITTPYLDADLAARRPSDRRAYLKGPLSEHLEGNPRDAAAWAQRAYVLARSGDGLHARRDLKRALGLDPGDPMIARHVRWSGGWTLLNLGDADGALDLWQQAIEGHGGHPFWATYSFALAHWLRGDRAEALRWYSRAALDRPSRWGSAAGVAQVGRGWGPREREALNALFSAWLAEERLRRSQIAT